jgi:hypothetical protein
MIVDSRMTGSGSNCNVWEQFYTFRLMLGQCFFAVVQSSGLCKDRFCFVMEQVLDD